MLKLSHCLTGVTYTRDGPAGPKHVVSGVNCFAHNLFYYVYGVGFSFVINCVEYLSLLFDYLMSQ
jgi:hypothetical protein